MLDEGLALAISEGPDDISQELGSGTNIFKAAARALWPVSASRNQE